MGTDELDQYTAEREGDVDHQPVFVATEIKDDPVVAHEVDSVAELAFYLHGVCPSRNGCNR